MAVRAALHALSVVAGVAVAVGTSVPQDPAPLDMPSEVLPDFYDAYRHFSRLLADPAAGVSFKLSAGDLMMPDNHRVLHARKGFAGNKRHMQGCYADKDGLYSTLRILEGRT